MVLAGFWGGCVSDTDEPSDWAVEADVDAEHVIVTATVFHHHTDFIHMSIRRHGWDNDYTIEGSPDADQPERDWSRVHAWFGVQHRDTYLEGRIDDGRGVGPDDWLTVRYALPRGARPARRTFPDEGGSAYQYITTVYAYADGHVTHPAFEPGEYEIELYPWYTGPADALHPAADDSPEVQYVHYEAPLVSTTFVIE